MQIGISWEYGLTDAQNHKKIDNKDLLYSTGNCISYLVVNCNGKNLNVQLSHFAIYLKLTQYYKSTIFQF